MGLPYLGPPPSGPGDLATLADVAAPGYAIDRTGAPYTLLVADIGRTVIVDAAVTLPVLGAEYVGARVDLVSEAGADITPALASGVAALLGAQVLEPGAALSLVVRAADGAATTYRAIGGRA